MFCFIDSWQGTLRDYSGTILLKCKLANLQCRQTSAIWWEQNLQQARYAFCWYGTCKMQLHNDHTRYNSQVQTFTASRYPDQIKPTNLCRCPQMQRLRSVFWRHGNISKFNFVIKSVKLLYLKTAINWNEMEQFLINFWILAQHGCNTEENLEQKLRHWIAFDPFKGSGITFPPQ